MNHAKIAAIVLAGFLVLWGAALFFGLPFLYGKKMQALLGQPVEVVRRELGPPVREWADAGPVFQYADKEQGWTLTFDGGVLWKAEHFGPVPDAGT